eukprot:CAMPEP_0172591634 /NCGR_PEP_ID=MMETSP1068-20121228/10457_1 /TAXON_ID=35684 /ORGANISM="Pseudopedinella elastica, Strain CCMP716" /LENGTH=183 /DNA_ID=CAMNT_0013388219 /DNA_START=164 /DNA_END=715 /DNA_ORIENTATION=-
MNPEGMYLNSKLGIVPSNELVDCDSFGRPLFRPGHRDFVYVDELACVGCKLCTGVAPATFFMEPHDGNARAYQQMGDSSKLIDQAIAVCPVNCIYRLDFEKLNELETRRDTSQIVNKKQRLVGAEPPRDDRPLNIPTPRASEEDVQQAILDPTNPNRWDSDGSKSTSGSQELKKKIQKRRVDL